MRDSARRYPGSPVPSPSRPTNTEDPNTRVPRERTVVDYGTDEKQPVVTGFVPSAPDPVPVYVVQNAPARRGTVHRVAGNMTIAADGLQQIAGADTRRKRGLIRNVDAAGIVYVLPNAVSINIGGFVLEPAQDIEMFDTEEIWLKAGNATVDVTWLFEYEADE